MLRSQLLRCLTCLLYLIYAVPIRAELDSQHTPIHEAHIVEIEGARYKIRHLSDPDGTVAMIGNRSGAPLRVISSLGMSYLLLTDKTSSWPCEHDAYHASFVIERLDGHFIVTEEISCGDVLHVVLED